ncbi:MAG: acyltransferase [Lachnospiraceae bacterium]|nr:acyltransferase [Lachnospiraceae bacterium]
MKKHDLSLDILRVLSCIMVFGVHMGNIPGIIGRFLSHGSTGVDFFFILSGFLAYRSLSGIFKEQKPDRKGLFTYWVKRAARILPLYYLIVIFYMILYYILGEVPEDPTGLYWLRYLFFLNLWVPTESFGFWMNLGALWTISVFVLFYLIAPFYYRFVQNYVSAWAGVIVSFGILKLSDMFGYEYIPIRFLFYFFLGILLKIALDEHKEHQLSGIFTLLLIFLILTDSGKALAPQLAASLYILMTGGAFAGVSENSIIYRVITFLSMISYSVYLDHVFIMSLLGALGISNRILWVALTLVMSVITYYLVEKKFGNFFCSILLRKAGSQNG